MAGTRIVFVWRIVIHHIADENGNRKILTYEKEDDARSRFEEFRDYWGTGRNGNGHTYKLVHPTSNLVAESFDSQ
ncbi:hypothetical protein [Actinomadura rubrisoli]|uniref:Uncharacterized protein n=1 Tax=Actinomadura rubrisoli TaxID=2530368 RepID=A0A4R4ZWR9_9ACTN|nr:hypothetical protein [Actinomadura rubrisoli]TDD62806.1 hypothetical protein E1298_44315 [Actinomadura rubrisoli]